MLYTVCPNATEEEYAQIINVDFSEQRKEKNRKYFDECKKLIVSEELKRQRETLKRRLANEPQNQQELLLQIAEINRKING